MHRVSAWLMGPSISTYSGLRGFESLPLVKGSCKKKKKKDSSGRLYKVHEESRLLIGAKYTTSAGVPRLSRGVRF